MGLRLARPMADVESPNTDTEVPRRGRAENKLRDLGGYLPLYKAAIKGNWDDARRFLDDDPEALRAEITIASERALHIAVGAGKKSFELVKLLIIKMSPEDLALTDQNGETALSVAAVVGNVHAAKLLVDKNPDLPYIPGKSGLFPIHRAAYYGQKEMISYLLKVTRDDITPNPFRGEIGGQLLSAIITAEFFDIALKLIKQYPEMATVDVHGVDSPLTVLAKKSTAFPSGEPGVSAVNFLNICGRLERKKKQRIAIKLVKSLCMEILLLDDAKAFASFQEPLFIAAKLGTHEIIEEIVEAFPPAIWAYDEENRNLFQLAVLHRRENVFNLIYQLTDYQLLVTKYTDQQDNNILHLAGKLPRPDRLKLASGAALQVQRELQWFKEVEKFVQPAQKEATNKDGKTPRMVFREEHQELMKNGEKWMKKAATSCTVAATLIVTVAFNAAIHFTGGSDFKDGIPSYYPRRAFYLLFIADAISLFTSVTSILMFLSVLTSRYLDSDFLTTLPTKLIIGLTMLFFSIMSMMIAFSSAIHFVLSSKKNIEVAVVSAGGVAVGLVTFFWLLPLLWHIIQATYCGTIFGKQKDRLLH